MKPENVNTSKSKEDEIMDYLMAKVFNPILDSPVASKELKRGVRLTIIRMEKLDFSGRRQYYWSAIRGTEKSTKFARQMKAENFTRFEEILEEFREKFDDKWLRG